ncbi:MAG: citramalate synthase [Methanomassiliicoccaceae archaeon]|nr:citramalate synthase [Methanomassiliicoccaceae archaeon]
MKKKKDRVFIYDTTLRDGAQSEGVSFSTEDKIEILKKLDSFGIDFVEGGWPSSNPKDDEFFAQASKLKLRRTALTAFGSTCRHDVPAENDAGMKALAAAGAEWVCIFGKAWDFHVTEALKIPLNENLRMVGDSVAYLKGNGKKVIFDCEHFFDGHKKNRNYAMDVVRAAVNGGADWIILCDTNGGSLPGEVSAATRDVIRAVDAKVGIHCHNDSDLAVACSLAAVESGARMVQGTINGIGERCGNANLCSIMPDLSIKMGYDIGKMDLTKLSALSGFVGETANMSPHPGLPYVGERAFAHKGGMHISALSRDTRTYEHVSPDSVGNKRKILISDLAGRASISAKLKELGISGNDEENREILGLIKDLEAEGYQFDYAEASFEMLVKRFKGEIVRPFNVIGFRMYIDEIGEKGIVSEASVKVVDRFGNIEHTASDGDGPVNALDGALRKALARFYPVLNSVRLIDYKVRVLDEKAATAATVRVLIRSTDGSDSWTTVGVSKNVIEASFLALVDSMEYAVIKHESTKQGKKKKK